jgi:hypothetical protein
MVSSLVVQLCPAGPEWPPLFWQDRPRRRHYLGCRSDSTLADATFTSRGLGIGLDVRSVRARRVAKGEHIIRSEVIRACVGAGHAHLEPNYSLRRPRPWLGRGG